MPRFKLYLVERPTRAAPTLDALVNDPAVGLPRDVLDGFVLGKVEGPMLILADDDHDRVQGYWERCHRDGLAVCIFDHSTAFDRLRDWVRARRHPRTPNAQAHRGAPASGATIHPPAGRPSPAQGRDIALAEPGILDAMPRLRAVVYGAALFALLLGVAWWMVPPGDASEAMGASSPQAPVAPAAASARTIHERTRGGAQVARASHRTDVAPHHGTGTLASSDGVDDLRVEAEPDVDDATRGPERSGRPSIAPLLLAFVAGLAATWGVGEAVARRGVQTWSRARRRATVAAAATILALTLGSAFAVRISALAPPPASTPPRERARSSETAPIAERPVERGGPFARFLRRNRVARGASPPPSFAALLAGWRSHHASDAAATVTPQEAEHAQRDAATAIGASARRHRRRHPRRAEARHASAPTRERLARDTGSDSARHASADATAAAPPTAPAEETRAPVVRAPSGAAPQHVPASAGEAARHTASTAAPPVEAGATDPHTPERPAPRRARESPRPRPRDPSPLAALALGMLAGIALSPRWRALVRGGVA